MLKCFKYDDLIAIISIIIRLLSIERCIVYIHIHFNLDPAALIINPFDDTKCKIMDTKTHNRSSRIDKFK